jgi:hypothetical protein
MTGSAHPAEKSATSFKGISLHRLYISAKVWVQWLENGVVVGEDYLGTVGLGHVYLYAALQNNVYGLAWLLNG